ncbi:MAG: hypothetical protein NE334_08375 [Lentisphaeraceae bacterium]|nr:hypothetical protein [Lentisphaeraceae bacterium]
MNYLKVYAEKNSAKWFTEFKKAFKNSDLELYSFPESIIDDFGTIAGNGSVSGIQVKGEGGTLLVRPLSYNSTFDLKLFSSLIKHFAENGFRLKFAGEPISDVSVFLDSKKFIDLDSSDSFERDKRRISKVPLLKVCEGKSDSAKERLLADLMHEFTFATTPEMYPVDDKESFIWDGSAVCMSDFPEQVLFSQKSFDGKLRGLIEFDSFQETLPNLVFKDDSGIFLRSSNNLSSSDIKALNVRMEKFEAAPKPKKPEKLTISVGELEELSYEMSKTVFNGKSLEKFKNSKIKSGMSEGQLETTGLAVSAILEIAATSKGKSLEKMTAELKEKISLTKEASLAVANGFFKAAKEEPEEKEKSHNKLIYAGVGLMILVVAIKLILK